MQQNANTNAKLASLQSCPKKVSKASLSINSLLKGAFWRILYEIRTEGRVSLLLSEILIRKDAYSWLIMTSLLKGAYYEFFIKSLVKKKGRVLVIPYDSLTKGSVFLIPYELRIKGLVLLWLFMKSLLHGAYY